MRYLLLCLAVAVTAAAAHVLDTRSVLPAPLGRLLSPQEGIWQNADPVDARPDAALAFPGLKGPVDVYFDERLVPHVFARQEADAYFVQGWLHARYRLWQMEFQTLAAAGRISEVVGPRAVDYDRGMRRMGMTYAAENALRMIEADADTREACDSYTAGVNAYIASLDEAALPLEYKLLGYRPEKWTNLKTALFTKAMTNDLAGYDRDFEYTRALALLGERDFRLLYPEVSDSLSPVVPNGTAYPKPLAQLKLPADLDSAYYRRRDTSLPIPAFKPDPANGSNNWAVAGSRTASGAPILANDPHLRLSLPAIWYEMQIHTPAFNAYGVSFPGIPGIVIGFNEDIAFGFTNAGRDVRDYYEIRFRDDRRDAYWFDGGWKATDSRVEEIRVKGASPVLDTVPYTVFGPVIYDRAHPGKAPDGKAYALRWVAHDPSNILRMWHQLNRARNYDDYLSAIRHFNVPGQSMLFAARNGDIALWQQAHFPLRWKDQGLFLMPGQDSTYMWQGFIPAEENPHVVNPEQGYISSANQRPADTTYPYFIPGTYEVYRGIMINRRLAGMTAVTPDDMMRLQNDNHNLFAEYARPILLRYTDTAAIGRSEAYYLRLLREWNLQNDPQEKGPTIFTAWWDSLQHVVFSDELNAFGKPLQRPDRFVLLEALLRGDSTFRFLDDVGTPQREDAAACVNRALRMASRGLLDSLEARQGLAWGRFKNTTVYHLLRDAARPFARPGLPIGGGVNIINATTHEHGPSWRMVVQLSDPIEAYAVYPGGQDGNPGSRHYDRFIDDWARGKYYRLWFMRSHESDDARVLGRMTFKP